MQHHPARAGRIAGGWVAFGDAIGQAVVVAGAAIGVGQPERRRRMQRQREGRVVQPPLVRQPQPQRGDAAVRHGAAQRDEVCLLIATGGAFDGADVEVLRRQGLRAGVGDAGLRGERDGQQAGERRLVDRLVERQRDGVEVGAVGCVGRPRGAGRRQQRDQPRGRAGDGDGLAPQRLPRLGRAELQGARADPGPCAGLRRGQRDQALRGILRAAVPRPRVGVEQDGDGVPAAQEAVGHDMGAVGPLQPVQRRLRHQHHGAEGGQQGLPLHGALPCAGGFMPTRVR